MNNKKTTYTFEVCANSALSCLAAQEGGAQRVELCAGIPEGGTTPSYGEICMARQLTSLNLHVIIRPRGGDFLYTSQELDIMELDICQAREAGADGVVFGCLTPDGRIDHTAMKRLLKATEGLSVTFHRAFDYTAHPLAVLEELIDMGINRILTSGQRPTASEGTSLLSELVRQANGRIIIMPGCGINESNIARIAHETGACEFHFSARDTIESKMKIRNPNLFMGHQNTDEYFRQITTAERVRRTISALTGK